MTACLWLMQALFFSYLGSWGGPTRASWQDWTKGEKVCYPVFTPHLPWVRRLLSGTPTRIFC